MENRYGELRTLLDGVADERGGRHGLIIGDARSGRTSLMQEAGRRLSADGGTLVIDLRLREDELGTSGLYRGLLSAAVEALVADAGPPPSWYQAWCDRVYLRDRSPMAVRDVLVSALAFAADNNAILDPAVVVRDLQSLSRLAEDRGATNVVVLVDDADELLEDPELTESLLDALDAASWRLIMASRFSGATHLIEAVSPVLRRVELIPLRPLWLLNKIRVCFAGPLSGDDADRLLPKDADSFLLDVLRLTSGNPFEIALVGYHLWIACRLGEQEHYELTPKVLDRVLTDLARHTGGSAELRAGAKAVRELPPDRMGAALDLVALSELTTRQIAIARTLGVPNGSGALNPKLLTCDLDAEQARVEAEIKELEELGVVSLGDDGRFSVQGGHQAAIALKYHARSFAGNDPDRPFGIPFIACVGDPFIDECAVRAGRELPGCRRLASGQLLSPTTSASAARLRAALESIPFAGLELHIGALDTEGFDAMSEIVGSDDDHAIAVVNFTVSADGDELDLIDVWSIPDGVDSHQINQALSAAIDSCRPLIEAAEHTWNGAHHVLYHGQAARDALTMLMPRTAEWALRERYSAWAAGEPEEGTTQVAELSGWIVETLRMQRGPDRWELSAALSRHGFMLSLCDDRGDEALTALEEAIDRGPADGWVTRWNLAHVCGRLDEFGRAAEILGAIADPMAKNTSLAYCSFFLPDRDARHSLVEVNAANARALHALQLAVLAQLAGASDRDALDDALADCAEADPESMKVAKWVLDAFGPAPEVSAPDACGAQRLAPQADPPLPSRWGRAARSREAAEAPVRATESEPPYQP